MTESTTGGSPVQGERQAQAVAVVAELLRLSDLQASLDVKDTPDGGISIAIQLAAELPGVIAGRRGTFVDALQFLVNKLTNRPGTERRWVALGVGEHPAPRGPRPPRPEAATVPRPPPVAQKAARPAATTAVPPEPAPQLEAPRPAVSEDPELSRAARAMAEASARTGRFYGLLTLSAEDRSRVLRAVADVAGMHAAIEGDGRLSRLVFTPERPAPMPRRLHPLGVADDEEAGTEGIGS